MTARISLRRAAFASCALLAFFALTTSSEAATTVTNLSPSFGTVGTTVTIYGTNFGATTGTVKFYNGKTATVSSWNGTTNQIVVKVPTGATTGVITVTPHGGTGVSSTADFNVLATKGALVLGAFPPQAATCSGIPDYNGTNCIGDYQSDVIPSIDGVVIVGQWSTIESSNAGKTGSGGYSWTSFDATVNKFVGKTGWSASKKVAIVLSPITDGSSNTSTPAYVFNSTWATTAGASAPLDECTCSSYSGDGSAPVNQCWNQSGGGSTDISGMPAVWEKPFYVALENFYSNAVTHLNAASYAPYVAYIRMGLSSGGEEYPHCSANLETLVTPSNGTELETVWTGYTNTMFTYEAGLDSQQPLMAAPNGNGTNTGVPSDAWADTEAQDALNEGLVLGGEGLQYNDSVATPCSNDWCNTFTFTPTPAIHELQTYSQSVPSQTICSSAGAYGTNDTNSLVCLLPFVEGEGDVNSVELYPGDVFLAFDSATTGYSTYGSGYATAIGNIRAGD
ncbi:MAG: IPT/TIG domain-containing protein [Candidatus Sulfotelmatobacter sp.]